MLLFLLTRFFPIISNHPVPLFLILIAGALYTLRSTSVHKWLHSFLKYSRNFQLPFKFCVLTRDFCLLIYVWWKYCYAEATGSKGDSLSGSRTFWRLGEADLNVTFSWMLLSLIGIWKLHSLGREKMQFKLLLMILPASPRPPKSNIVREYLKNQLFLCIGCPAVSLHLCSKQEVMEWLIQSFNSVWSE